MGTSTVDFAQFTFFSRENWRPVLIRSKWSAFSCWELYPDRSESIRATVFFSRLSKVDSQSQNIGLRAELKDAVRRARNVVRSPAQGRIQDKGGSYWALSMWPWHDTNGTCHTTHLVRRGWALDCMEDLARVSSPPVLRARASKRPASGTSPVGCSMALHFKGFPSSLPASPSADCSSGRASAIIPALKGSQPKRREAMLLMRVEALDILLNNTLVRCPCGTYSLGLAFIQRLCLLRASEGIKSSFKELISGPNLKYGDVWLWACKECWDAEVTIWHLPIHFFFFLIPQSLKP